MTESCSIRGCRPFGRLAVRVTALLACVLAGLVVVEPPAGAAPVRVEAEALSHTGGCWGVLNFTSLSGGAGRTCHGAGAPLSWSITAGDS